MQGMCMRISNECSFLVQYTITVVLLFSSSLGASCWCGLKGEGFRMDMYACLLLNICRRAELGNWNGGGGDGAVIHSFFSGQSNIHE